MTPDEQHANLPGVESPRGPSSYCLAITKASLGRFADAVADFDMAHKLGVPAELAWEASQLRAQAAAQLRDD